MQDEVDNHLTAVFQDVPVPEGLAERLLERLSAERCYAQALSQNCEHGTTAGYVARPKVALLRSRRWLLVGGGLLAATAGLVFAVWLGTPSDKRLSEQLVLDEAIQSFKVESKNSGRPLSESPAEYPISRMVRHTDATKWRPVDSFFGGRGVAYDLSRPAGPRATLYVVARAVEGLMTSPTLRPFTTAGSNCCASAWQEGGLLYVLVVQGDRATYESYLKLPRSPVALASRSAA